MSEGLAGEAVATGRVIQCQNLPDEAIGIQSGLLSAVPRTLSIVPIRSAERVIAVLELGYMNVPRYQEEVLTDAVPVIAFSLALLMSKQSDIARVAGAQRAGKSVPGCSWNRSTMASSG